MSFYLIIILSSACFGYLSTRCLGKRFGGFFFLIATLIMLMPLALRGMGVDYDVYYETYKECQFYGWEEFWRQYNNRPEPLYALLNFAALYLFNSFQGVNFLCALLSIGLTFIGYLQFRKVINFGLVIISFGMTYYLFMFGLNRMMIAVSIYIFAYRPLLERRFSKYCVICLLASGFHYSALVMIPIYFAFLALDRVTQTRLSLKQIVLAACAVMVVFLVVYNLAPVMFGGYSWFLRYSMYFMASFDLKALNNNFAVYPLILLLFLWSQKISDSLGEYKGIFSLFLIGMFVALVSLVIPVHRFTYYFFPCAVVMYATIPRAIFLDSCAGEKYEPMVFQFVYVLLLLICMIVSVYYTIEINPHWAPYIGSYSFGEFE